MGRRLWIGVLGMVLTGGLLWWGGRGRAERVSAPDPAGETAPNVDPVLLDVPQMIESGGQREQAPRATDEEASAARIAVVRAEDGAPVPGAEVWLVPAPDGRFDAEAFDELVQGCAARIADARGLVVIPWPQAKQRALARAPGLAGAQWFPVLDDEAPSVVELHPDGRVEIVTIDPNGVLLPGVPVEVGYQNAGEGGDTLVSDANGRVVLRHPWLTLARYPGGRGIALRVDLPLPEPVYAFLDAARPPRDPVRLVVPALGSVLVHVRDEEEGLVPDGTRVTLEIAQPGSPRVRSIYAPDRPGTGGETLAGAVRFDLVPVDAKVELTIDRPLHLERHVVVSGPTRTGAIAEHTITLVRDEPWVTFRVLGLSGEPLGETRLELREWRLSSEGTSTSSQNATSDAEGRISMEVGAESRLGLRRLEVSRGYGMPVATVDLTRSFPPGRTDLGDVALRPVPLLVAGRALLGDGAGVATSLQLQVRLPGAGADVWAWFRPDERSAADGSFEIHGPAPGDELRLRASGATAPWVACAPGDIGLELLVPEPLAIRGRVLLDRGTRPDQLIRLRTSAGAETRQGFRLGFDGTFSVADLPDRPQRLEILTTDGRVLRTFDDVLPTPARGPDDPRLAGIDLRGELRSARIEIVTPNPWDVPSGTLRLWPVASPEEATRLECRGRTIEIALPRGACSGELAMIGYERVSLATIEPEQRIELRSGRPLRLVLPSAVTLPEPPRYLKAVVAAEWMDDLDWGVDAFDERREIVTRAPGAGRFRVRWILERQRRPGSGSVRELEIEPVQWVELGEGELPPLELTLDDAALRRAIEAAEGL